MWHYCCIPVTFLLQQSGNPPTSPRKVDGYKVKGGKSGIIKYKQCDKM